MDKEAIEFKDFKNSKYSTYPHYLVIGHPVSHSLSPVMHAISLEHYNIEARYIAVDLPPQSVTDFISWVNRDSFLGCNITIPWKQHLLELPDQLSKEVEIIGAMNTISKTDSSIIRGENTDIYGFKAPLKDFDETLEYGRAVIFGSGGASLAVQYALMELGYQELIIVSRNPASAEVLQTPVYTKTAGYNQWQEFADETELFVNTTPLGMGSLEEKSPVQDAEAVLLEGSLCYDLVYNPGKTRFLKIAESAGAEILNGLDMLIHQGSRSFQIWTGHSFPLEKIKDKLQTFMRK